MPWYKFRVIIICTFLGPEFKQIEKIVNCIFRIYGKNCHYLWKDFGKKISKLPIQWFLNFWKIWVWPNLPNVTRVLESIDKLMTSLTKELWNESNKILCLDDMTKYFWSTQQIFDIWSNFDQTNKIIVKIESNIWLNSVFEMLINNL